ncbi:MAG: hypothetical protein WC683_04500 [bacterium]
MPLPVRKACCLVVLWAWLAFFSGAVGCPAELHPDLRLSEEEIITSYRWGAEMQKRGVDTIAFMQGLACRAKGPKLGSAEITMITVMTDRFTGWTMGYLDAKGLRYDEAKIASLIAAAKKRNGLSVLVYITEENTTNLQHWTRGVTVYLLSGETKLPARTVTPDVGVGSTSIRNWYNIHLDCSFPLSYGETPVIPAGATSVMVGIRPLVGQDIMVLVPLAKESGSEPPK